ncbi:MAG TPA: ABC transporter ATP-binding protein [Caldilineae bacterium]|jgi:peptide/nickel transport system ATP-binding protein|nr:ABC transporter ATP-binding protein [Caldilineae bacterium]
MGELTTSVLSWQVSESSDAIPLSVRDLWVEYATRRGAVQAVRGVSFDVRPGESLALIGESGSGKTTLGLALIRLLATTASIRKGQITYRRNGQVYEILSLSEEEIRQFRWRECAMVFQSALNAFNPVLRIWDQINDTARAHGETNKQEIMRRAMDLLRFVQLEPERVIMSYPHELSGGMRQRVLLALALLLNPQILILDEPTTALDILTQRSIIDLLRRLKEELHFAMIFISHDLSLAAELADRVATMYAGAIVEIGEVHDIFYQPRHPYTLGLIRAVPTVTGGFEELASIPGSPPDLVNLPSGCKFHERCAYATERCRREEPTLVEVGEDHYAACFYWDAVARELERSPVRRTIEVGD